MIGVRGENIGQDLDIALNCPPPYPYYPIPPSFCTLASARDSLVFNWHTFSASLNRHRESNSPSFKLTPLESLQWQEAGDALMSQWSDAFKVFLENPPKPLSPIEQTGSMILKVQSEIVFTSLQLQRGIEDSQLLWDKLLPHFSLIVDLVEEIFASPVHLMDNGPSFSLDLGLVGPLYEVAARCRDPVIRRRAIALLKVQARQEGVWNSVLTAKVAERVVEIEEMELGEVTCCSDVPEWARISDVLPQFDTMGRRATVRYTKWRDRDGALVRREFEDLIEW